MKVGDLVIMPPGEQGLYRTGYEPGVMAVGVVVKVPEEERYQNRVAIYWVDGDGYTDWEPAAWLEVISESR